MAAFPTRRVVGFLAVVGFGAAALFALYTVVVLNWSYSTGDRAGTLLKLANKGWVCKTWEGELVMPILTTGGDGAGDQNDLGSRTWYFTVRDEGVVEKIQQSVGKRVVLTYDEHKGIPGNCFGDTPHFVTNVRLEDVPAAAATTTPTTTPPATPPPATPTPVPAGQPLPSTVPAPATP